MIQPIIHQVLRRDDLARLVAEIARQSPAKGKAAAGALESGDVDRLLDSPAALEAVRGNGGIPAALPLSLLWYVPIRAALRDRGIRDIDLADFAATVPVVFSSAKAGRRVARGARGLAAWWQAISAMPRRTVARGECAAECGAAALWWAGCFPESIVGSGGAGMLRSYVDFSSRAFGLVPRAISDRAPETADLYERAASQTAALWESLLAARGTYLRLRRNGLGDMT